MLRATEESAAKGLPRVLFVELSRSWRSKP